METRFIISNNHIQIQELPKKGLKRLRVFTYRKDRNLFHWFGRPGDNFIIQNVLRTTFPKIKEQFQNFERTYLEDFKVETPLPYEEVTKTLREEVQRLLSENPEIRYGVDTREEDFHYLKIAPVGCDEETTFKGKDFSVRACWTEWSCYSPNSDFQSHDPHYTRYVSTSAASGRKLFKKLQKKPDLLSSVSWGDFKDFLNTQKIKYDIQFSVWR